MRTAIALLLCLAAVRSAGAQSASPADRGYLSAGVDLAVATPGFTGIARPIDFGEAAVVSTTYPSAAAPGFDVAGGARVWRRLAIGVDVSRVSRSSGGSINAQVPHPFFFNRPRTVTGSPTGLGRDETAVHVQALWMLPI